MQWVVVARGFFNNKSPTSSGAITSTSDDRSDKDREADRQISTRHKRIDQGKYGASDLASNTTSSGPSCSKRMYVCKYAKSKVSQS